MPSSEDIRKDGGVIFNYFPNAKGIRQNPVFGCLENPLIQHHGLTIQVSNLQKRNNYF